MNDLIGFIVALVTVKVYLIKEIARADCHWNLFFIQIEQHGQPPQAFSFGWQRSQILGAFFNGVFLLALGVSILFQAIERFIHLERKWAEYEIGDASVWPWLRYKKPQAGFDCWMRGSRVESFKHNLSTRYSFSTIHTYIISIQADRHQEHDHGQNQDIPQDVESADIDPILHLRIQVSNRSRHLRTSRVSSSIRYPTIIIMTIFTKIKHLHPSVAI